MNYLQLKGINASTFKMVKKIATTPTVSATITLKRKTIRFSVHFYVHEKGFIFFFNVNETTLSEKKLIGKM